LCSRQRGKKRVFLPKGIAESQGGGEMVVSAEKTKKEKAGQVGGGRGKGGKRARLDRCSSAGGATGVQ